jgi:hypothetical protein
MYNKQHRWLNRWLYLLPAHLPQAVHVPLLRASRPCGARPRTASRVHGCTRENSSSAPAAAALRRSPRPPRPLLRPTAASHDGRRFRNVACTPPCLRLPQHARSSFLRSLISRAWSGDSRARVPAPARWASSFSPCCLPCEHPYVLVMRPCGLGATSSAPRKVAAPACAPASASSGFSPPLPRASLVMYFPRHALPRAPVSVKTPPAAPPPDQRHMRPATPFAPAARSRAKYRTRAPPLCTKAARPP